jgi:hypothetical protein
VADTSVSGFRMARELDRFVARRGSPKLVVSYNDIELTRNAILVGAIKAAWHGPISRLASRRRTLSSRPSTAACTSSRRFRCPRKGRSNGGLPTGLTFRSKIVVI